MNAFTQHLPGALLELTVLNHPSVFARLANLCSRRAYVIEGMFCPPAPDAAERRLWLLVQTKCSPQQVEQQLLKLEDVCLVRTHGSDHPLLAKLTQL
jgi:acetolactate synthase small subunit